MQPNLDQPLTERLGTIMQDSLSKAQKGSRTRIPTGPEWLFAGIVCLILTGCNPDRGVEANVERTKQEHDEAMRQPDLVHRDGFIVMGTVIRRKPGTERPETFASIWNDFETHHETIRLLSVDSRYYGVSFRVAEDGSFDYLAGMAVGPVEEIPGGLEVREMPAATYAVFACPVRAIGATYGYIFGEWRSTSGCEVDSTQPAFEQYPPTSDTDAPVLIHIPVRIESMKSRPGRPGGAANASQPIRSERNQISPATDARP